jgi:ankyrin repeat protein/L-ascorbate metabolism protein UlaG (beta-lactamase superfamily)
MEIVKLLIDGGAEIDARNTSNQGPLLYAAYMGNTDIVKLFIANGAEVDYHDTRQNTPLFFAARQGHPEVVNILVSSGAEIDARCSGGRTPFHAAASADRLEAVEMLAALGADINTMDDNNQTPFVTAIEARNIRVVDFMLKKGVTIDATGEQGRKLLHMAAATGFGILANHLITEGADIKSLNDNGGTLLHSAVAGGLDGLAAMLVKEGFNINAIDNKGRTPLHYAVYLGRLEIIEPIVDHEALVNVADNEGMTPLHIAEDWGRQDIADILVAKGATQVPRKVYKVEGGSGKGEPERVAISYIANEGFLITHGDKKILIDAIQRNPWNYVNTSERIFRKMVDGSPPFDGVDLCIGSHPHADHVLHSMIYQYLSENPDVMYISSQISIDSLKTVAGDGYGVIAKQVKNVTPEWKTTEKVKIKGIDAAFFGVNHAGPDQGPILTLATVLDLGGIRLAHLADLSPPSNVENFEVAALDKKGIDICFVDPFFLQDSTGQHIMKEHIKPEYMILMHVRRNEVERYTKELGELYPELIVYDVPMKKKIFEK